MKQDIFVQITEDTDATPKEGAQNVWNEEAFIEKLKFFDSSMCHKTIYGGEPTTHVDRVLKVAPYCHSIATNLLVLTDELKSLYDKDLGVLTAWEPGRFSDEQYATWLKNIDSLKIQPTLRIYLTPELVKSGNKYFQQFKDDFDGRFEVIRFTYTTEDYGEEFGHEADEWLCQVYWFWKSQMKTDCDTFDGGWGMSFTAPMTLRPDGTISIGCMEQKSFKKKEECKTCYLKDQCTICKLVPHCVWPKRLVALVDRENRKNS